MFVLFLLSCDSERENYQMAELELQFQSELGEGAIWDHRTSELYWVDILEKTVNVYNPESKSNMIYFTDSSVGTVVPCYEENQAIIALEDGVYLLNRDDKTINLFSSIEADNSENRFNDGKCDPLGNLWVGSMHLAQSKPNGNLYKVNGKGEAEIMKNEVTISNGIVWTSDGKTMYYIDTPTQKIMAYDFNMDDGTISNEKVAVAIDPIHGFPDGMAIDAEDKLWVGMWNGNAVARFDPVAGTLMTKIEVPAHNVTSCAFGGPNLETLYITTASVDMTEEELKKYPFSGSIFKANPGIKGVKCNYFKLNVD